MPLQAALRMGLQQPQLAATALQALEQLSSRSRETLEELAPAIIPLMEPYLMPINDTEAAAPSESANDGTEADTGMCKAMFE